MFKGSKVLRSILLFFHKAKINCNHNNIKCDKDQEINALQNNIRKKEGSRLGALKIFILT